MDFCKKIACVVVVIDFVLPTLNGATSIVMYRIYGAISYKKVSVVNFITYYGYRIVLTAC